MGVSDMTLLSTISNESINENLKKRFQNGEIYVSSASEGGVTMLTLRRLTLRMY